MAPETQVVTSNTYLWSGILQDLKKLCIFGQLSDAICAVDFFTEQGIPISISVFFCLLQSCIENKNLRAGRQIYLLIIRNGIEMDTFLGCHLMRMFSACGSLLETDKTFLKLLNYDSFTWTAIISAHAKFGSGEEALKLYKRMLEEVEPADYTFNAALQACTSTAAFSQGNIIHSHIVESSLESDVCIGNTLINMYAKCGSIQDAGCVFDDMPKRGIVAWSSIISGYADKNGQKALQLFSLMLREGPQPNIVTFIGILRACASLACLIGVKLVHALIIENNCVLDLKVTNILIDMYGKCGSVEDADFIFHRLCERTLITWSTMLSLYADYGHNEVTLHVFQQMQLEGVEPDCATFAGVLKACSQSHIGKLMHVILLEKEPKLDDFSGSILIDMYFRLPCPSDAYKVFRILPRQSVPPWNGMIAGFSQHGFFEEAMFYFQGMQVENLVPEGTTYASIVKACADNGQLAWGKLLCSLIVENSCDSYEVVGNALVSMYAKCGSLDDARRLFDSLLRCDAVTWSAMIAGYVLHGFGQEALKFYYLMQLEGKESDNVTFLCTLKACSLLSALHQGRLVHAQFTDSKWEADTLVRNSLIDMYSKCGSPQDAFFVFNNLPVKTVATWNTMISAFVHHSNYPLALKMFEGMQQEGLGPNHATFASLLSACNQLGLVHEGRLLFSSLSSEYGITPKVDHYACFIELLSRAGRLLDAVSLVMTLPFAPDLVAWTSLLNQSKAHGDLELGKQCLDSLVTINSIYASGYAIMSNFLADASLSEDADNMQTLRKQAKAWKKPGEAFIEVRNEVHSFTVHDLSQQKCELLGGKLQKLSAHMKRENYMPLLDLVLHDACNQKSKPYNNIR